MNQYKCTFLSFRTFALFVPFIRKSANVVCFIFYFSYEKKSELYNIQQTFVECSSFLVYYYVCSFLEVLFSLNCYCVNCEAVVVRDYTHGTYPPSLYV